MRLALAVLLPGLALAPLGLAVVPDPGPAVPPRPPANEDESRVPPYTLPDPLVAGDGSRVTDAQAWRQRRRPEVLELFRTNVYGRTPERHLPVRSELRSVARDALAGRAVRKQVTLWFGDSPAAPFLDLLVYLPQGAKGRVPAFLGLNFDGNQAVSNDPGIALARSWLDAGPGVVDHRATQAARGVEAKRWPVERILERGYALATAYYGDVDPDFDDGFENGVHPLFYRPGRRGPIPTSGARSAPGPGGSLARSTTSRPTGRSTPHASRSWATRASARPRCGRRLRTSASLSWSRTIRARAAPRCPAASSARRSRT